MPKVGIKLYKLSHTRIFSAEILFLVSLLLEHDPYSFFKFLTYQLYISSWSHQNQKVTMYTYPVHLMRCISIISGYQDYALMYRELGVLNICIVLCYVLQSITTDIYIIRSFHCSFLQLPQFPLHRTWCGKWMMCVKKPYNNAVIGQPNMANVHCSISAAC